MEAAEPLVRRPRLRRRIALSILGSLLVTGALGVQLAGRSGQFTAALRAAPIWLLSLAVLLNCVSLLARTEAWNVCVRATGATNTRRVLYRAAGTGYLLSVLNGSLGLAARIASLRQAAPLDSPPLPALLAAEIPIITVEVMLTAVSHSP